MTQHHSWTSLDTSVQLHVNSGEKSFKLRNTQDMLHPEESHVTCHDVVERSRDMVKLVMYVKSGCDSGYMCSVFMSQTDNVIKVQFGHKARIPGEVCSDLYFSSHVIKTMLLVSSKSTSASQSPCPLSGRYTISPQPQSTIPWVNCPHPPAHISLTSGCGASAMTLEHQCSAAENVTQTEYGCHASWVGPGRRTNVIISRSNRDNDFLCLSYTDSQGVLSHHDCHHNPRHSFNLSLSGPCVQALSAVSGAEQIVVTGRSLSVSTFFLLIISSLYCLSPQ